MPETLLTQERLTKAIFEARTRFVHDKEADATRYVKLWKEDDVAEWGPTRAFTLILRTRGCTWDYQHSCTMCGYFTDVLPKKLRSEDLETQWSRAIAEHRDESILKIYTGGNFIDPAEVFPQAQRRIISEASKRFRKITVETRPEYLKPDVVAPLVELARPARLEFAIGLESSSDEVCGRAINKGYGFKEFLEGAKNARAAGAGVKTYLLLKPPFLTEDETVEDVVRSIAEAAAYSDVISVNPTNVQSFTLVDRMYRKGEYRPPWLWSILEVLARGKPLAGSAVLKSDPVGGGSPRGAHNCGRCDERVLPLLDRYNATQDLAFVAAAQAIECSCKKKYQAVRAFEGLLHGAAFVD